jgi:hypothetical protein
MARLNVYAGDDEEKKQIDTNLSEVTKLLGLETYKGASSSAFVRWLGKQIPHDVANALRVLREKEMQDKLDAMRKG